MDNGQVPDSTTPLCGDAARDVARAALLELDEGPVGRHLGVRRLGENLALHRFSASVPGYPGWEWTAVVACAPGSEHVTINEVALLPGNEALKAPEWVPYEDRVRPGELGPNDQMPPRPDDPRLERGDDGYALSEQGLSAAKDRWRKGETGPNSDFARVAKLFCKTCAFCVPAGEVIGEGFGVCTNEYSADGRVVQLGFGCGAHSDTPPAEILGQAEHTAFDDEKPIPLV